MKQRTPILMSACLLGEPCRYDGKSTPRERAIALAEEYDIVKVCPEQLGGLPTPRIPSERQPDGRVLNRDGEDWTEAFERGARQAVEQALEAGCACAVLKARSPSCGVRCVYDGSFSGKVVCGQGVAAEALRKAGVVLFDEETCEALMPRGDGAYWVYMLRCADDTLYTGITTDVARRMSEHMSAGKLAAKYTRVHGVAALEAVWPAPDRAAASALEYRIKRMPRAEKLALIGR